MALNWLRNSDLQMRLTVYQIDRNQRFNHFDSLNSEKVSGTSGRTKSYLMTAKHVNESLVEWRYQLPIDYQRR